MKETNPPDRLGQTLISDLHEADMRQSVREELRDVYEYYLDQETRDELQQMGRMSRWLHLTGWLVKASILRLSRPRRVLFVLSLGMFLGGLLSSLVWVVPGSLIVTFILLLELKDKLLAQDRLLTGRAVQLALMPRENPAIAGWETWLYTRPAREVGGDLVDYLHVENHLQLALGDVSGKGIGAALLMAQAQSTLRAIAPRTDSLSVLVSELNSILRRDGLPGHFMSLVYLELTASSGKVKLINAGHMPPFVVGRHRLEELPKGGAALGLMEVLSLDEQTVDVRPGDVIVIYSDGLTEARNVERSFFERERLLGVLASLEGLSARSAGQRLLHAVEDFTEGAEQSDDLSLIVLKRLAPELP